MNSDQIIFLAIVGSIVVVVGLAFVAAFTGKLRFFIPFAVCVAGFFVYMIVVNPIIGAVQIFNALGDQ